MLFIINYALRTQHNESAKRAHSGRHPAAVRQSICQPLAGVHSADHQDNRGLLIKQTVCLPLFRCDLSDGYCYITCLLSGQARLKSIKNELELYDVVRLSKEDVIVLGLERSPAL